MNKKKLTVIDRRTDRKHDVKRSYAPKNKDRE